MSILIPRRSDFVPHDDYGFFGPDSVTWKVWSYPTSLTIGFQRAVVVEELDPNLVAAVDHTQAIVRRARTRYDRTLRYFAMVAFADTRSTTKAADVLVKIHSKGIGTDPHTQGPYDANAPHSQLWIHLTAWHSILYAYERFGPGKLKPEDEARYWAECAIAAELQTCDPSDVPRSREGIQQYFEEMRPQLAGSEAAQRMMHHLLGADILFPPLPLVLRPGAWVVAKVIRAGTVSTMPRWMRDMGGIRQSRLVDVLVRPVLMVAFFLAHLTGRFQIPLLWTLSPMTVPVVAPILLGIPPKSTETMTPYEAQARYGYDRPAEAHQDLRARQHKRVFGEHIEPSDEGILESEPILGAIG